MEQKSINPRCKFACLLGLATAVASRHCRGTMCAGTYFAIFWVIFNVGGVVGGIITFVTNYESADSKASGTTFLAFMAIMMVGTALTLFLLPPGAVKRSDGTAIVIAQNADRDTAEELRAMAKLFKDKGMLRMMPMFLYSNWFLGYHFGV